MNKRSIAQADVNFATHRASVEIAAREYIAARTGIPIGYITVYARR